MSPTRSTSKSMAKDVQTAKTELGPKLVIIMCGLPARGKSYLSWCGFKTKVFNVGNRRRIHVPPTSGSLDVHEIQLSTSNRLSAPPKSPLPKASVNESPTFVNRPGTLHEASFFDSSNKEFSAAREKIALETLDELIYWLNHEGGRVAIHDATNSTLERRRAVTERIRNESDMHVIFVESICTAPDVLEKNILMKLSGPDYIHMPREEAIADFRARMVMYEKSYEPISEAEEDEGISYIKIINVGKKVIAHNIHGYLPSQCVFYLMQINIKERTLWLSRHGESTYNKVNRIGGDPPLTPLGAKYARTMNKFIQDQIVPPSLHPVFDAAKIAELKKGVHVWSSNLQRTLASVEGFEEAEWEVLHFKLSFMVLGEIFAGICEDMTYEEIQNTYPEIWHERAKNKLSFRYPGSGGESYKDVIERLRPLIVELERTEDDLAMPTINVPLHTLYKVSPRPYGADVSVYQWNADKDAMILIGGSELLDAEVNTKYKN
ncbi:hypothetical protein HK100_009051 [Physocladia obscura]|uniref:6-phosphofructo-2-kinase domain-containing protein n=1 Tax=Physocladia obscura TaxID=109957 RepID=A0AAD5XFB0_9FUNG|nr:hypothetical protein HK100_009051 [Physocladia obscura]